MGFSEKCRLVFCALHIPTMKKEMRLSSEARTTEEIAAAKAFKRVFWGIVILTVLYVIGLVTVFGAIFRFLTAATGAAVPCNRTGE